MPFVAHSHFDFDRRESAAGRRAAVAPDHANGGRAPVGAEVTGERQLRVVIDAKRAQLVDEEERSEARRVASNQQVDLSVPLSGPKPAFDSQWSIITCVLWMSTGP